MGSREVLTDAERNVLVQILSAGDYKVGDVHVSRFELTDKLGIDITDLVSILRRLSSKGLIELGSLPLDIGNELVRQLRDDIDALDLTYLEHRIDESQYTESRGALVNGLKALQSEAEPLSPLEAAKLFLEKNLAIEQVLRSVESIQEWKVTENLSNEILMTRDSLLPFRRFILSRIDDLKSGGERSQNPSSENRMKMLVLFSQVGLSGLVASEDVASDLVETLELLRARCLVGEISETDLKSEEQSLRQQISERLKPVLPDHEAFRNWKRHLGDRLDAISSCCDKGVMTDELSKPLLADLNEDIALLDDYLG